MYENLNVFFTEESWSKCVHMNTSHHPTLNFTKVDIFISLIWFPAWSSQNHTRKYKHLLLCMQLEKKHCLQINIFSAISVFSGKNSEGKVYNWLEWN